MSTSQSTMFWLVKTLKFWTEAQNLQKQKLSKYFQQLLQRVTWGLNYANLLWPRFGPISLRNLNVRQLCKLCSLKRCTTFVLADFKVFKWNLEICLEF
jgi:hypothetical protein